MSRTGAAVDRNDNAAEAVAELREALSELRVQLREVVPVRRVPGRAARHDADTATVSYRRDADPAVASHRRGADPAVAGHRREADTVVVSHRRSGLRAGVLTVSPTGRASADVQGEPDAHVDGAPAVPMDRAQTGAERFYWIFDMLRERLAAAGASERSAEIDDFGLDADALTQARPLLDLLYDRYWRVELAGEHRLPADGPCLFVANRSGLLPWDGLMLAHALERARPGAGRPRFLVADWLITRAFAQPALVRLGAVRACPENAQRLLTTGRSVIAFPEGMKGAAKAFRQRYRLQRFGRGGAVRAALRARVPLVPVAVVGAEEVHPILFKTNTAWTRSLGLPFLPVTPTFPWLGPLGLIPLRSHWRIAIGEPIPLPEARDVLDDELEVSRVNETLRARVQGLVDRALAERESATAEP